VDTGCLEAERLVARQDDAAVALLGPPRLDEHWQAREGTGVAAQPCQSEGDHQHATGPAGKTRTGWTPAVDQCGHAVIKVKGSTKDGRHGEPFTQGVRSHKRSPRRTLTLRPQPP
jgi:hypothetical protein